MQVTIHFHPALVQFPVHRVQATIHFQLVAQFHAHHNAQRVHRVQEWQVHALDLFDQVLLRVRKALVHLQVRDFHRERVVHPALELHIKVQAHLLQELRLVQVVVAHHNAVVQVVHLEKMRVRNQVAKLSLVKHFAMSSTICRRHNLVAQLFHMVMEKPLYACAVALRWPISPTRLVLIQLL